MKDLKAIALIIIGMLLFALCIYGSYWLAKTGSYMFFYEDMVRGTIQDMVKAGSLK